jgi:hypothetical protein
LDGSQESSKALKYGFLSSRSTSSSLVSSSPFATIATLYKTTCCSRFYEKRTCTSNIESGDVISSEIVDVGTDQAKSTTNAPASHALASHALASLALASHALASHALASLEPASAASKEATEAIALDQETNKAVSTSEIVFVGTDQAKSTTNTPASHALASPALASHALASHALASHALASHALASHALASHALASLEPASAASVSSENLKKGTLQNGPFQSICA